MRKFNYSKTQISQAVGALLFAMSAVASNAAQAMTVLDDQGLSDTTGADGIHITTSATTANFGNLYWQDNTDATTQKRLQATTVSLKSSSGGDFGADIKLNTGTSGGTTPGISLNISLTSPVLLTGSRLEICDSTAACNNTSLGNFAVTAPASTNLALTTTNGLFNQSGSATLSILLDGANVYLGNNNNQLLLSDIRASISATGRIWIDATDGLRLEGTSVNLNSVAATATTRPKAGIQMTLGQQPGALGATPSISPNALGFLQFGISGSLSNTNIYVRGTQGTNTTADGNNTQDSTNQIGATGIAMRLRGTLGNTFSLQYGEAGNTKESGTVGYNTGAGAAPGYGLIMSNFVPFDSVQTAVGNAKFDSGNVYLNLLNSNAGKVLLPTQAALTTGTVNSYNDFKLTAADFNHSISTLANQDRILLSIRGLEITGVPLTTNFYNNDTGEIKSGNPEWISGTTASNWSLIPVLNNFNANLTVYGDTVGANGKMGFSLDASTTGMNQTTRKDTAVFVADTSTLATTENYQYLGLRNINAFIKSAGNLQIGASSITLNFTEFMLAASGDFAAGYLPGSSPSGFKDYFAATNNDSLFGVRLKIASNSGSVTLTPGNTIGFSAELNLFKDVNNSNLGTSFFRVVDTSVVPTNSAALGLDQISGRLKITNGSINFNKDNAVINSTLLINPNNAIGDELLINQVNFYPSTSGTVTTPQTLGKMVVTGGQITSSLMLKPVTF